MNGSSSSLVMPSMPALKTPLESGMAPVVPWRQSLILAIGAVLAVRFYLTLILAFAAISMPQSHLREFYAHTGVPLLEGGWEGALLGVWQREDALWYQKIATVGYSVSDFTPQLFPLFPLLMKMVSLSTGFHPIASGILISEVALVGALFLLHRLALEWVGPAAATRAVIVLAAYPSVFFLHGPFSESLMLFLVLLSFSLAGSRHWGVALLSGYLAGLTRPQGMLLGPALALHAAVGNKEKGLWRDPRRWDLGWRHLALLIAPAAGALTFFLLVEGPWRAPGFQGGTGTMAHQSLAFPGTALFQFLQVAMAGRASFIDYPDFAQTILFGVLIVAGVGRLSPGFSLCALLFLMAPLSRYSPVFPLMSMSRFVLLLFPCFLTMGFLLRRRFSVVLVVGALLVGMALLALVFYVGGFVA